MTSVFPRRIREDGVRVLVAPLAQSWVFFTSVYFVIFIISHFWQISVMELSDKYWESYKTVIYQRLSADMKIKYAIMHVM